MKYTFIDAVKARLYSTLKPQEWSYPARMLEETAGIQGISARWNMPEGKTEHEIGLETEELFIRTGPGFGFYNLRTCKTLFRKLATGQFEGADWKKQAHDRLLQIIELNPQLSAVRYNPDSENSILIFLYGITSGFNAQDIDYFLNRTEEERTSDEEIQQQLSKEIGHKILWFPSPQTREQIRQAIVLKNAAKLVAC